MELRDRRRVRPHPPSVRPAHRLIPGDQAPVRGNAVPRRAGQRAGLGRGPGSGRRAGRASAGRSRRGGPGAGYGRGERQGLHSGPRRDRLHLGARRPPVPAPGACAAPVVRRQRQMAGAHRRARPGRGPPAAGGQPARRGQRCGRQGPVGGRPHRVPATAASAGRAGRRGLRRPAVAPALRPVRLARGPGRHRRGAAPGRCDPAGPGHRRLGGARHHEPRHRGPKCPVRRPDAARRDQLVPAFQRARGGIGPGRAPDQGGAGAGGW